MTGIGPAPSAGRSRRQPGGDAWLVVTSIAGVLLATTPAAAAWQAASPAVAAAARRPAVAAVLAAMDRLDRSLIDGDHSAFAALLADDLVVNNPQNGVSEPGATARRNAGGRISYASYDRRIDYAGMRDGLVVLMGEEIVVPRPPDLAAGQTVRRRFTDLWRRHRGGWRLALRQATIISSP